jgi:hypothetical protein
MPSPFPGMDPRLESPMFWREFQFGLLYAIHAELNCVLPDGYAACVDLRISAWPSDSEGQSADEPKLVPKVGPVATGLSAPFTTTLSVTMSSSEPFVRIQHLQSVRDVCIIEAIGPERKKKGHVRDRYLWKRNELLGSHNLIEIDLLRKGERFPVGVSSLVSSDYSIMVSDKALFSELKLWAISIRNTIPSIPVPLDYFEEPVVLNVKKCIDRAFDDGAFVRKRIDRQPIHPPLAEPDAAWGRELLTKKEIPS